MSKSAQQQRRSFLNRIKTGAASLAAIGLGGSALAQVRQGAPARWEPARHPQDDWLDQIPGQHRMIFDTVTVEALGEACLYASNFLRANRTDYGLENSDCAVVIVLRHRSTAFGYKDAMWEKYGAGIAARSGFQDPKTKAPARINVFNAADYGAAAPNFGITLDSLAKQGVQFAVCSMATRAIAGVIAQNSGGNAEQINSELIANLVGNARMVPAGIVAVNRAQERGYSLVTA